MLSNGMESIFRRDSQEHRRFHDGATAREALRWAAKTGFQAVNADLMFRLARPDAPGLGTGLQSVLTRCGPGQHVSPFYPFPIRTSAVHETAGEETDGRLIRSM
jgi:coproporphyrinogen III oxidase-like Fe-S oxidoreductase